MLTPGIEIVIRLKQLKMHGCPGTQRWLLEELHSNGFPELSEATLSSILNGYYTIGCANDVLREASKIVEFTLAQVS